MTDTNEVDRKPGWQARAALRVKREAGLLRNKGGRKRRTQSGRPPRAVTERNRRAWAVSVLQGELAKAEARAESLRGLIHDLQ